MAWTVEQRDALQQAIATGTMTVSYADGRSVTYRSQREMLTLLDVMNKAIGDTKRQTVYYPVYSSGL